MLVLGTAQDGGYPHTGCNESCCARAWKDSSISRLISSIAIIEESTSRCWVVDISPDFKYQYNMLADVVSGTPLISGIFITHAHRGHYTGLLELGLETMDTRDVPVYAMSRMREFLEMNEPFATIIRSRNIELRELNGSVPVQLGKDLSVTPFPVPHRNELSETVGFLISSEGNELLYLPDIDSWDGFEADIKTMVSSSNIALIDGTFYSGSELGFRDMSCVPHPPISDSMSMLSDIDRSDRNKVYFTHLNHTNPATDPGSVEAQEITENGFNVAADRQRFIL